MIKTKLEAYMSNGEMNIRISVMQEGKTIRSTEFRAEGFKRMAMNRRSDLLKSLEENFSHCVNALEG